MKKILSLFTIFGLIGCLNSAPRPTQDDFNACYQKSLKSMVDVGSSWGVALTANLIAVPKQNDMPINNYVKFDPFLGLYLVSSDKKLDPIKMSDENTTKKSDWVSVTSDINSTKYGHVKELGERLGDLDTLNFDVNSTGLLLSPCCNLRGIVVGSDKFVPNRYLRHFLSYPDVYYGDIGAVFHSLKGKYFVKSVDQLGRGKALMTGDEIVTINDETFADLRSLNERILFAKKGEILTFGVIRNGILEEIKIAVSDEQDDKNITKSDSNSTNSKDMAMNLNLTNTTVDLFRARGMSFDDKLVIKAVDEDSDAAKFGIKAGDKLMQIDQKMVKSHKDVLDLIKDDEREYQLLFRRDNFDFFYKVK
ncbi:MAG: DUF7488 domain-containing protein [Campylobacter sp.]